MSITLSADQISWIVDRINEARNEMNKALEKGIHNIDEAKAAVNYDEFLTNLYNDIDGDNEFAKGTTWSDEAIKKVTDFKLPEDYKVPEESLSSEDVGAPVIPEINSTHSTDDNVTAISSAQEQMTEAQEKAMEDIFDL